MNPYLGAVLGMIAMWVSGYTTTWFLVRKDYGKLDRYLYFVVAVLTAVIGASMMAEAVS